MEEKQKRSGGCGDVWHGLFGKFTQEQIFEIINQTVQSENVSVEKYADFVTITDATQGLPVQVILLNTKGKLLVQTAMVKFIPEYENISFKPDTVDEWLNGIEGTLEGEIFERRDFSFYCQNYLAHKGSDFRDKKININMTVVARIAEVLPDKERSFKIDRGPLQGESVLLEKMRYLNPITSNGPELCQFFFPIQEIRTIKFFENEIYKIKGVLTDTDTEKDYFYNVFINKSSITDTASLKVGEPLKGWGWIQAEITGGLP